MLPADTEPPINDQGTARGAAPVEEAVPGESPALGMPSYLTPLIGRDEERRQLASLLTSEGQPMVVVTGGGGIGKTRLAVQIANDLHQSWRHGTRFLSFASVPATTDLDAAFAWRLGLRDAPHQSHRELIHQYLRFRETLLVVDNVEHLPEIANLLTFILTGCARVALLVTSRAELGLYGEVTFLLQPLAVRTAPRHAGADRVDAALARQGPAVRLFTDRVRAINPDFDITAENASDVLAICEHLGGVPLALELAASQMTGRTTSDLLDNLAFNSSAPPHPFDHQLRHRLSLYETIRVSYDLLSRSEQQAFRTLTIMRGMWSIEDVLPLLTPDMPESEAIDIIGSLAARSLLQPHHANDDVHRFVINPMIHRFGEERVAAVGERPTLADRHARRMGQIAIEAEPNLTGPGQTGWLARIDGLHEDFRMAHDWLMQGDNAVEALRMSTALWRYAYTRGRYQDVRSWIRRALAEVDDHDGLRTRALNGIGLLANVSGNLNDARRSHEEALGIATRTGQHREIAIGRIGLADVAVSAHNDADAAIRHLGIARAAYGHLGDRRGIASVLTNQGNIEWQFGDLNAAFTTHEEARELYRQAGDTRGVAWSDTNTGRIAAEQGDFREALPRLHRALDTYVAVGDLSGSAEIMEAAAKVALAVTDATTSSMLAGGATALRKGIDSSLKSPDREAFDSLLAELRELPDHDHKLAFGQGSAMSLDEALDMTRSVEAPASPGIVDVPDYRHHAREACNITGREHEVLMLICDGLSDAEIGERLGISPRTVQTHVNQLLAKLNAASRVALVGIAIRGKIVPVR